YATDDAIGAFQRDVLDRLAREPAVTSVAFTSSLPMGGSHWTGGLDIEGRPPWPSGGEPNVERIAVSPGYFKTMGIPILRGRDFSEAANQDGRLVTIISQDAADRFFPGEDPIGRRVNWGGKNNMREIVGVVGSVRSFGLTAPIRPQSYAPYMQKPIGYS